MPCLVFSYPFSLKSGGMNDSKEHLFVTHNSFIRVLKVSSKLGKLPATQEHPRGAYDKAEL